MVVTHLNTVAARSQYAELLVSVISDDLTAIRKSGAGLLDVDLVADQAWLRDVSYRLAGLAKELRLRAQMLAAFTLGAHCLGRFVFHVVSDFGAMA